MVCDGIFFYGHTGTYVGVVLKINSVGSIRNKVWAVNRNVTMQREVTAGNKTWMLVLNQYTNCWLVYLCYILCSVFIIDSTFNYEVVVLCLVLIGVRYLMTSYVGQAVCFCSYVCWTNCRWLRLRSVVKLLRF